MRPVLFHVPTPWGDVPIYAYGFMLGISLLVGWVLIMRLGASPRATAPPGTPEEQLAGYRGLDRDMLANAFLLSTLVSLAGARLTYVLTNPGEFDSLLDIFHTRKGGMVAYGAFLGGTLTSWLYLRRRGVPFLAWGDVGAPALCAGTGLTRIGCYLFGCDFGVRLASDAPGWLEQLGTFPHWQVGERQGAAAWVHHVNTEGLPLDATHAYPVHPTQLYESAAGFVLLALALWLWPRRRFRGQVFLVAVAGYALFRFGVEFWRGDPQRGGWAGFSTSQWISLALLPAAGLAYAAVAKRARTRGEPPVAQAALEPVPVAERPEPETRKPARGKGGRRGKGRSRRSKG